MKSGGRAGVIIEHVRRNGWGRGVELGLLKGQTFFALLDACPDLLLVGVDIWKHQPDKDLYKAAGGWGYMNHDLDAYRRDVVGRAELYGGRAIVHQLWTVDAAALYPDAHFDFVFIDADHLYEAVKADLAAWLPKIRTGGMMMGHDYCPKFPGVMQAVDERFGKPVQHAADVWSAPV